MGKENGDILSSESAITIQSKVQTQPTPSSYLTTIKVTSQVKCEMLSSDLSTNTIDKPSTSEAIKEDEVKNFHKEL